MTRTTERRTDYAARVEVSLIRHRLRTRKIGPWQAQAQLTALGVCSERIAKLLDLDNAVPTLSSPPVPSTAWSPGGLFSRIRAASRHAHARALEAQSQALMDVALRVQSGAQALVNAISRAGQRRMARRNALRKPTPAPHPADIDALIGTIGVLGFVAVLLAVVLDQFPGLQLSPLISMAWGKP